MGTCGASLAFTETAFLVLQCYAEHSKFQCSFGFTVIKMSLNNRQTACKDAMSCFLSYLARS